MPGGAGGAGGQPRPPPGSIMLSPEEDQAIKQLMEYGFSKVAAAQAYFACEKNIELALNFLLENGGDDEGGAGGAGAPMTEDQALA